MKLKISAVGSCVSRDPFNSLFNPEYKDFFTFKNYQFQSALISLMSQPVSYDSLNYKFVESVSENTNWHFRTELNKRFLAEVVSVQPHYLIIDFYSDVLFGVVKCGNSFLTNKKKSFSKNNLWSDLNLGEEINLKKDYKKYKKLFKQSAQKFAAFCREYLPGTKIVVNSARFTNQYWDPVAQELIQFAQDTPGYYENLNNLWSELDDIFIKELNCSVIKYTKKYYADPNYRYGGLHTVHYMNNFYSDFKNKLLKIIFDDLTDKNISLSTEQSSPVNLIQNSNFQFQSASWQVFSEGIFEFKPGKLQVASLNNQENQWNQIVSDAIELYGESRRYFFRFEFQAINLVAMRGNEAIMKIRTFEKRNVFKSQDAVKEITITKDQVEKQLKRTGTNVYEISFELVGRFVKIIPYLQKNGSYEVAKLSLTQEKPLNYAVAINENVSCK